tara:strand:- start:667 stop:1296 length:630 start_codon:yes stop_codon:yes gene_type:complete
MQSSMKGINMVRISNKNFSIENDGNAPPGQIITEKFPVLTFGNTPSIDLDNWKFSITGSVSKNLEFDYQSFLGLGEITLSSEFHCVTQWSNLDNQWSGIPFKTLFNQVQISRDSKFAMIHCYGGYSTNLSLDVLLDDDVLFATKHNGETLSADHGAPLRLIVPKRYGWKSAKWVNGIEFMEEDAPGFWEMRGYHMEGDPHKEQRFDSDK